MKSTKLKQEKSNYKSLTVWIFAARPKTLPAAATPVVIACALSYSDMSGESMLFDWLSALLCLLFALIMQIDANFVNDLFDYLNGNDDINTRLGPVRVCSQGWISAKTMKRAVILVTLLACIVGLPLAWKAGAGMIIIGAICVLACMLYSTHLARKGWGDALVFVFFGLVPVCFTYYIQRQTITWETLIAATGCGLVIDGLLMVNNWRDRFTDEKTGKRTLIVILGERKGAILSLLNGIVAVLLGVVFAYNGHYMATLLPIIYLILHIKTWRKMMRINTGCALNGCLADCSRNIIIYAITLSLGFLLS